MSQMCSSGFKSCVYKGYIIRDLAPRKKAVEDVQL